MSYVVDAVRTPVGRCPGALAGVRPEIVNPNGGAIAIGHPLGCSGVHILNSLVWELAGGAGAGAWRRCASG
jgi:acetyl-CoA acetyltransferase